MRVKQNDHYLDEPLFCFVFGYVSFGLEEVPTDTVSHIFVFAVYYGILNHRPLELCPTHCHCLASFFLSIVSNEEKKKVLLSN